MSKRNGNVSATTKQQQGHGLDNIYKVNGKVNLNNVPFLPQTSYNNVVDDDALKVSQKFHKSL